MKAGDRVRYVPYHAHGDITHADCEDGVVTSVRLVESARLDAAPATTIFVRFGNSQTSQGCKPDQLVRR